MGFIFPMRVERQLAFEKAEAIVLAHQEGRTTQQGVQRYIEGYFGQLHPMGGTHAQDFSVSTSYGNGHLTQKTIRNYNWNANP
jgi:hypothetical protein